MFQLQIYVNLWYKRSHILTFLIETMNNPLEQFEVKPTNGQVKTPIIPNEWTDENVFKHIQEKIGREVTTWDDLKMPDVQPTTPIAFANEDVEKINKYIQETGRTIADYFESQKDWSKVDNKTLVMGDIREQYPTLSDEEIQELYDEEYGLQEIDTEYDDEDEIKKVTKQNKRKEIKLKTEAEKVRQKMESLKQKYNAPSEAVQERQRAAEDWSNSMKSALQGVNVAMEDGFTYDFADKDKYGFLNDVNNLFAPFKNAQGGLDYQRLAKTIIVGLEHDNVLKEYGKFIKANTVKESMAQASNKSNPNNNPQVSQHDEEWRRIAMENFRKHSNKF